MAGRAALSLDGRVFIRERSLLIYVALNASRISSGSQPGLLKLKAAMRIVTIAASHSAFQHLVMERHRKLRLHFRVTTDAKLWVICFEHSDG